MTVPNWLDDAVHNPGDFSESIALDVAGIITTVRAKLVTTGNWTEPSTALFKSVPTASGVWFDVLLARIDADTLDVRVRDQNGNTIRQGRIDIEAAVNTTVEYYWGDDYLVIASRRATPEIAQAWVLDPTALGAAEGDQTNRVVAQMYRDTSGTVSGTRIINGQLYAWDNAVSTLAGRVRGMGRNTAGTSLGLTGPGGRLTFPPAIISINQSGTVIWTGALPGAVLCDSSLGFDTVKNIPVDTGTSKAFIVLPLTTIDGIRLAVRKPSVDP